jgi:hypothetical protein
MRAISLLIRIDYGWWSGDFDENTDSTILDQLAISYTVPSEPSSCERAKE